MKHLLILFLLIASTAFAADTRKTKAECMLLLADSQADGAISEQDVRDCLQHSYDAHTTGGVAPSNPCVKAGDIYTDSVATKLYYCPSTGGNWVAVSAGISNVVEDTTPQLGGDLDLNSFVITGLVIGTNVQAYDADLTTYAGITPSANIQTFLGAADYAAMRTQLGLVIGTNVQAYDADLTTYAGITPSANMQTFLGAADYAAMRTQLGLVIGTNVQAYDADLTTYAGITPSANVQTLLGAADYAAFRTSLGLVIGTNVQAYSAQLAEVAALSCTDAQVVGGKSGGGLECQADSSSGGSPGGSAGDIQINDGASGFAGRGVGAGLSNNGSDILVDTSVVPTLAGNNTYTGTATLNGNTTAGSANTVDFSGADATLPVQSGTTLPGSCTADKELFLDTDATDGQQLYVCNGAGNGWTLVGDGGGGGAPTDATYITQTPDATLSAEQALSALATGLVKNTTTTGVLSIAASSDVIATFDGGSCGSAEYLKGDGTCATPSTGSANLILEVENAHLVGADITDSAAMQCGMQCELVMATGDEARWSFIAKDTISTPLTIKVLFKMASATANNVEFTAKIRAITPGDSEDVDGSTGYGSADASADETVPGTAGYLDSVSWSLSGNEDSIAAGDLVNVHLERTAPSGTDATGNAEVVGVVISW